MSDALCAYAPTRIIARVVHGSLGETVQAWTTRPRVNHEAPVVLEIEDGPYLTSAHLSLAALDALIGHLDDVRRCVREGV
jgi:hypothetical protein